MSKWQDKSEFEINRAVAIASGIKTQHKTGVSKYKDSPDGYMVVTREPLQHYPFDPVNKPEHSWPIMESNGIAALSENGKLVGAANDSYEAYESYGNIIHSVYDSNPLRAAMIVYLEMNGVKP